MSTNIVFHCSQGKSREMVFSLFLPVEDENRGLNFFYISVKF
jgi:hypothetical protein